MSKEFGRGIRRNGAGWQVFARVNGRFLSKALPLHTSQAALIDARRRLIADATWSPAPTATALLAGLDPLSEMEAEAVTKLAEFLRALRRVTQVPHV